MEKQSKIKINWNLKNNKIDSSTVLINGVLFTCIILSIASGFIDLTFFSGLSKSLFHVGTIPIPAAVLYTIISIGFILAKFWCAMQIGMLKELKARLLAKGKDWANNLKKALLPWQIVHKFLITVSIITALSLSVNSIGVGIRKMEQNIKNMSYDAETLIELNKSANSGEKEKREAAEDNIAGAIKAKDDARKEVDRYYSRLVQYQEEYFAIPEDDTDARQVVINKIVREIPGATAKNAIYFTKADLQRSIQRTASANETVNDTSLYEEAVSYDKNQIEEILIAISDKEYKMPDGTPIKFIDNNGKPINVQLAISRLQNGISMWQADTGDVGESSKVFTLLAMYIKADETAGGIGAAEWMIMLFIFFTGIIQECMIALCTPSATIDRKTLSSVSRYCEWKNEEEKERFLLRVYKSYVGDGVFNQADYEEKCRKCVELMEETEEDIIAKYSKKHKMEAKAVRARTIKEDVPVAETKEIPTGYSDVVARKIKEVESI